MIIMLISTILKSSTWFWVALLEFLIIVILIIKFNWLRSRTEISDLSKKKIKEFQKTEIDMDNLMSSINYSKNLYNELSKKCHPDKFTKDSQRKIADKLFQEISTNKRNYQKLLELKQRAIDELNLKF